MAKFINQVELSDFLIKSVLGKGHDSLSEQKTLSSLQKYFSGDEGQIETVAKVLSGCDHTESLKHDILLGIDILNLICQEISSEQYRSTANNSIGKWAFVSNILIPQISCLYSDIFERLNKKSPLYYLEFFLQKSAQGVSPSNSAKKLLSEKSSKKIEINEELNSIKKNSALTNKSIYRLTQTIKDQASEKNTTAFDIFGMNIDEIEAFLMCSRYLQIVHNHLKKLYSESKKLAEIYTFFIHSILYAKIVSCEESFINGLMVYPRMYIHWHKKLYATIKFHHNLPSSEKSISNLGVYRAIRDSMRSYLFKHPNKLLPMSLLNPTEGVIGDIFSPFIDNREKTWIRDSFPPTQSGRIIRALDERMALSTYKRNLYLLSKCSDFKYHKHEYLYHYAVVKLREGDLEKSLSSLLDSLKECSNITAGKTVIDSSELIIFIKLLMQKKMNGGWYEKYIQKINLYKKNEIILVPGREDIDNKEITYLKLSSIINKINNLEIIDTFGKKIKFDPMLEFIELSKLVYKNYTGNISEAIHTSLKGHKLSRPISKPIPFTFEMALIDIYPLMNIFNIEKLPTEATWLIEQNKENRIVEILKNIRTEKQAKEHNTFSRNVNLSRIARLKVFS